MLEFKGSFTEAKVMIDDVEQTCISQIYTFLNHEAFTNPIAIMPDTHAGKGSVIGFTMKITDKVIPNVIGVDIGCGMVACNMGKDFKFSMESDLLDHRIRSYVPMGFELNERKRVTIDEYPWAQYRKAKSKIQSLFQHKGTIKRPASKYDVFAEICNRVGANLNKALCSIGTLGGGNHFIEFGKDTEDNIWFTVHTGSRNLGLRICNYWQSIAKKKCKGDVQEEYKNKRLEVRANYKGRERGEKMDELKEWYNKSLTRVPDNLEYLEGNDAIDYLYDMSFAQIYADWNREVIVEQIIKALGVKVPEADMIVRSIHNFIDFDDMMIRKGAIRSYKGEQMVIPFNMRDGILICEGKSNPDWNNSAAHGAGRLMSRRKAKDTLDKAAVKDQMKAAGIFTTNIPIDEAPGAYKDANVIEEALAPTCKILTRIKPIHNIKA